MKAEYGTGGVNETIEDRRACRKAAGVVSGTLRMFYVQPIWSKY